ncbi:marine proteobacterial sortase target protein [Shewanella sp. Choline-02u-19]|uniref:marine proteobacterial sortase target protein n=1 Tax=unclassified Shewanella TaxID=196818 RepID=UPI000C331AC1|nr:MULTISPECIES: marine proteobacterial sortase target protein [unclassified Shewanella]PKH56507.1 marine proteobacterial sortase target protein [Shewanella sp. Bg11-22]PKI27987.1 marine proteobacterial sortase target protein [Shewanella sp. Choline-02u-19]
MARQMILVNKRQGVRYWQRALLLLVSTIYTAAVSATGSTEPAGFESADSAYRLNDEIQQGSLIIFDAMGNKNVSLPMKTQVHMQVSGWTNRVSVRHEFHNDQPFWVNGEYVFPLPSEAAVDGLRMLIGDRVIEGEIKEKRKAKALFNEAKKAGKKASLLEQKKANIFSAQVANLAPGETLVVELNYQQLVNYDQGMFSLRFPMVVAPRYYPKAGSAAASVNSNSTFIATSVANYATAAVDVWNSVSQKKSQNWINSVDIEVELDAGLAISEIDSPYHQVNIRRNDDGQANIHLIAAKANSDFVLNWRPSVGSTPTAAIFSQQGKTYLGHQLNQNTNQASKSQLDPQPSSPLSLNSHSSDDAKSGKIPITPQAQYALVMLLPPQQGSISTVVAPRELILVIDTSGSMSGEAIEQAKSAIIYALSGLSSQDSFNILQFNSRVYALAEQSLTANAKNIGRAQAYVQSLEADGGTEMSLALDKALNQQASSTGSLRQVLFITDGAVGNEPQLFNQIRNQLHGSRLFTIGIGAAPNGHFMQRAAELGRGTYTYIGKQSEVKSKMVAMLDKLEKPTVTDVELRFADGSIPDYWPATIPDLYAHEPIMVAMKLPSYSEKEFVVSGQLAGQFWQQQLSIEKNSGAKGLDLIWARKQIAALELSKEAANNDRIEKQITAISLNYHVMSAYTSLVAIDKTPARPDGVMVVDGQVLPHMPKGWQRLPQTATSSYAWLILGSMLLGLSILYSVSFCGNGSGTRRQVTKVIT